MRSLSLLIITSLVMIGAVLVLIGAGTPVHGAASISIMLLVIVCITAIVLSYQRAVRSNGSSALGDDREDMQRQRSALLRLATSEVLHSGDLTLSVQELTAISAHTLRVERVGVWLFNEDRSTISCFSQFERTRGTHSSGVSIAVSTAPRYFSAVSRERVIVADDVATNPATNEHTFLAELGVTSMIDAPVYAHGRLLGIVCHEHVGPARRWKVDEQLFACCIADMVGRAFEAQERKRISSELRRKSQALEGAMEGVAVIESDGRLSYVNPAFVRIFGYQAVGELVGLPWKQLFHNESLAKLEALLAESFKRQGKLLCELEGLRQNASRFPIELSLSALGDGGLVWMVRDISRRKDAERGLIESRKFLRQVVDLNPNFVFVKDREGRFTLVNQAVAEVYGTTVENLIGRKDSDFNQNKDEVEHFRSDDLRVINDGVFVEVPEELITDAQGRERWLYTVKRPLSLPGSDQRYVLGVATDITERKRLRDQLLQSQKMEAIGQLAGGIAHDFNNLMTGILGYTTLLKLANDPAGEVYRSADVIERAANRASELTQKLLGFARKGKHQNVPIDLHAVINDTVAIINRTIEKNINVVLKLNAPCPFILGDPLQIQQIILNLAINARDAMCVVTGGTNGGELTIETRAVPTGDAPPEGAAESLELLVRDSGCGIAPEVKERIFEPFFTTKGAGKGTGLGLAMVYGIVVNHGGTIRVDSAKGEGTVFTLRFAVASQPLAHQVEGKRSDCLQPGRGKILVVDDHEVVREVTSSMLQSLGYSVLTAHDGKEGAEVYQREYANIDLVILDLMMPRLGARECLREMKRVNPQVRVIVVTGYASNQHLIHELMEEGAMSLVQKPYELRVLSEAVSVALHPARAESAPPPLVIPQPLDALRPGSVH